MQAGWSDATSFLLATVCFFGGMPIAWALDAMLDRVMPSLRLFGNSGAFSQPEGGDVVPSETADYKPDNSKADPEHAGPIASPSLDPEVVSSRRRQLFKVGVLACCVIAMHNMPEGLVTFLGYLEGTGISVIVAIAIHNVPEGMVVALPIYYATGSRAWAFGLSALSGLTEPLGALIGLAVACTDSMKPVVFGIVFGLVAGIMVYIRWVGGWVPTANFRPLRQCKIVAICLLVTAAGRSCTQPRCAWRRRARWSWCAASLACWSWQRALLPLRTHPCRAAATQPCPSRGGCGTHA
jgi:zinc transporter ZupT